LKYDHSVTSFHPGLLIVLHLNPMEQVALGIVASSASHLVTAPTYHRAILFAQHCTYSHILLDLSTFKPSLPQFQLHFRDLHIKGMQVIVFVWPVFASEKRSLPRPGTNFQVPLAFYTSLPFHCSRILLIAKVKWRL